MAYKGVFKPTNPQKYKGNPAGIIYRSSWELKMMRRFDASPSVLWWASEEMYVPYYDKTKDKHRRYFPDFIVNRRLSSGEERIAMIEVKPLAETVKPTHKPRKKRSRIIKEEVNWAVNTAKWAAARAFCEAKGWDFLIFTEKEIGHASTVT